MWPATYLIGNWIACNLFHMELDGRICVLACKTPGNIVFEVLVSLPFRKYMVCMVQNLAQWRNDEVKILQFQVQVQVKILHFDQHFILVG